MMLISFLTSLVLTSSFAAEEKPNFLILIADDLGYGDLAVYGNPTQEWGPTDDFIAEGVRFTQAYSADSLCSPARAALLTGRLPIRSGVTGGVRVFLPRDKGGLPRDELTLPELLKTGGYHTGMVGKWHLGINKETRTDGYHLPSNHGFDYVGINLPLTDLWDCDQTGTFPTDLHNRNITEFDRRLRCFVYNGDKIVQQPTNYDHLTDYLLRDFERFVSDPANQPFFFYFSFPHVHTPINSPDRGQNSSARGMFGDNVNDMSFATGKIMEVMKRLNLDEKTFQIFLSDHGPHRDICEAGGTTLFKGGKGNSFEGGFRIPFATRWPGKIKAGGMSRQVISAMDILPTILHMADVQLPTDRVYDGQNELESLMGLKNSQAITNRTVMFYCNKTLMAVRYGSYKIHFYTVPFANTSHTLINCPGGMPLDDMYVSAGCPDRDAIANDPPLIYDLLKDPFELYPVNITTNPELITILPEVKLLVDQHRKTVVDVKDQIGDFDQKVMPCCNPPKCECSALTQPPTDEDKYDNKGRSGGEL